MSPNPHKARWARRKAQALREEAAALPLVPASDWRGVRARTAALAALRAEADRFDRIAERFEARAA